MGQEEEEGKQSPLITANLIQKPDQNAGTDLHLSPVFIRQYAEVSLKRQLKIIYQASLL